MCDGDKLLREFKDRQPLVCSVDATCWCMRIQTKFTNPLDKEDCMSPRELLDQVSAKLTEFDKNYLTALLGRPFVVGD